ncbi:MAG: hypothetical protein IKC10_06835, partial [Alphaproteobacteria bacterium]|nr:hypothetical protein [Alphaproteobacteria bacterium]
FTYDSNGNLIKQSNGLEFFYDHTGVFAVKYNNATYFYRKDAQANIVALLDNSGTVVVKYKYDAWGNCVIDASTTNTELANLNPFRYRSYYLDTETGFYFLKTRYYDPEIGRFMTIDDISYIDPESINGLNLYAYCLDNPVMCVDPSGHKTEWWQWLLAGIGAALIVTASVLAIVGTGGVAAFGVGALIGAASLGVVGATIGGVVGYATGGIDGILGGVLVGFGIGAIVGFVVGGAVGYTSFAQPGVAFNPKHHSNLPQKGVNPNTIKYGRQKFDTKKVVKNFFETLKKGKIEKPITVSREGIVSQGNHRLLMAKLFKITIDVIIGGMSQ